MTLRSTLIVAAGGILFWSAAQAAAPVTQGEADTAARLDRIEKLLSSRGLLDMLNQLQTLQDQVSRLRGQIEVQSHELQQLKERQHSLYTDVDQRLQRLERGGPAATADGAAAKPANAGPPLQDLSAIAAPDTDSGGNAGSSLTMSTVNSSASGQAPSSQPPATGGPATPAPDKAAPASAQASAPAIAPGSSAAASTQTAGNVQTAPASTQAAVASAAPQTGAPARANAAANGSAGDTQAPMPEDSTQVQAEYEQAFQLLKQSQYNQAITAFQKFLAAHPQGQYSDNAQYWLAESYYVTGDFQKAIDEYQKLVTNFPDSPKLTHGLLKIAFCYQAMGKTDEARQRLEDLVQKYPGTTAAQLADERLKQLSSTPPAAAPAS